MKLTPKNKVIIGLVSFFFFFILILIIALLNPKKNQITENDSNLALKLFSDNYTTEDPIFTTPSASTTATTEKSSTTTTILEKKDATSSTLNSKTTIQRVFTWIFCFGRKNILKSFFLVKALVKEGPSIFPRSPFNSETIEASVLKIYEILFHNSSRKRISKTFYTIKLKFILSINYLKN